MGVPKFYRWTSERYPCLSEVINESQIPEFDNLYLDMNGIIHNCSHPNDDDVTFRITEEQIFVNIFAYIENLYNLIRPQKVFFMAVDGVAPRAKMNQQRARRFMSARTAATQMAQAIAKGEVLPTEERFDSNCITPGTYFMTRLHERLLKWIEHKTKTDPKWHGRRVILSGHNCPGEGEHKIMDFIRTERAAGDYEPNTRHCMYGLDADLIMLGIVSHEPHFSLLREEVTFNQRPRKHEQKTKRPQRTDSAEKQFHLLHLSLLREYLAWEFSSVKDSLPFAYDMERIVDDWILMGLLVGNDFLPHLPNVHIHDDALPLLYTTYKKVLPTLDGYINEGGILNLGRFETFLRQLAINDKDAFMDKLEDYQFMESKKSGRNAEEVEDEELVAFESSDIENEEETEEPETNGNEEEDEIDAAFVSDDEEQESPEEETESSSPPRTDEEEETNGEFVEQEFNDELATLALSALDDKDFENSVEACWTRTINNQFKRHKKEYYSDKMRYKNISKSELRAQAEGYVRAIQWNLHYYYHGCCSWSWFYPHHYAPFISDVTGFADMHIEFTLSEPFHPFEQLLAVLPEASKGCLPKPLQELMSPDPTQSPISDFYPPSFETDLNGKRNDWEAVVLIPFIDEKRLLEAIKSKESRLSAEEKRRNEHGTHVQCVSTYSQRDNIWKVTRTELPNDLFRIPQARVKWGLLPNVKMDVYFPGFPTMKHLSHCGELRHANCNVFGMASRKESMVLRVKPLGTAKDIIEWGAELCEEEVCVDWPILKLAKVDAIWGDGRIVRKGEEDEIVVKDMTEEEKRQWTAHVNQLVEHAITRYAIECGTDRDERGKHVRTPIAWVRRFTGLVYETTADGKGGAPVLRAVKQWASPQTARPVLLPLIVKDVLLENSCLLADLPVTRAYPKQAVVWVTDPKQALFGLPGMVQAYHNEKSANCKIEVVGMVGLNKVDKMEALRKKYEQKSLRWMSSMDCARQIPVDNRLFARITGTMFLWNEPREKVEKGQQMSSESKINCGMALKFSKRDICVAEYTDRREAPNQRDQRDPRRYWSYSNLTSRLVAEYKKKFPEVIRHLESSASNSMDDVYYAEDIWPNAKKREERFVELRAFLETLPSREAEQFRCGTEYADRQIIAEIERVVMEGGEDEIKRRRMHICVLPPAQVFRYELYDGKVHVDPEADFRILDRVGIMSSHTRVPKVLQGTVVGLHDDKVDVLFDAEFEGGSKVRGSTWSGAVRVPQSSLFNITFGLVRKDALHKKQQEQALQGAYVPLPPRQHQKRQEAGGSTGPPTVPSKPSKKAKKEKEKTAEKAKKEKEKPEENTKKEKEKPAEKVKIMKKKDAEVTVESLTESLNKLLKIQPKESESSEGTSQQTGGKQVSLMELLGGAKTSVEKAADKPADPSKKSILEQLNEAQTKKKEKKKQEQLQNKASKGAEATESTSSTAPEASASEPTSSGSQKPKEDQKNEQKKTENAVAAPAQSFFSMIGMTPINPHGPPGHGHQQFGAERRGYEEKRANPKLTDFKPSTVNARVQRQQQAARLHNTTKVTLITRPKEAAPVEEEPKKKEEKEKEEEEPKKEKAAKKPRKKKESRLGIMFNKPPV
ncbi:unnamed protein product [Caenorhabditis sp. 36 PRJEB53466]|nr:unnamed protein product [Caenorhabditis sp. 36 PRJEB53466]